MRQLFILWVLFLPLPAFCQDQPVAILDFVKVQNKNYKEALFYYENNWKIYRQKALQLGYIESFQVIQVKPDSTADFDLILMTVYKDSNALRMSEERFDPILKDLRPAGPLLLNSVPAADFRKIVFGKSGNILHRDDL